jgi:U3 small nucleolar RNA-associated protein 3
MPRKEAGKSKSKSSGKLQRWNTYDDIPDDEQDAFHRQQDKVVFEDTHNNEQDEEDEYGEL